MNTFVKIFGRVPTKKEATILERLINLYGQAVVEEATRASVVVTTGSPINYIATVAKNLYDNREVDVNYFLTLTQERLRDLQHYESGSRS